MSRGQSLFEIVIALAIFAMLASVLISLVSGSSIALLTSADLTQAGALADEAIEGLHSVRDGAFNELASIAPTIIDGKYTRTVTLGDVCRDLVTKNPVACPPGPSSFVDPHTRKVAVLVGWTSSLGAPQSVDRETYISNWDSQDWIQTDWSGGAGQTTWLDPIKFDSSDGNLDTTPQELKLRKTASFGDWQRVPDAQIPTPRRQLNAVDLLSENDAWVLGNSKKALRYSAGTWTNDTTNINVNVDFKDIEMISVNDGWAVADAGKIIHYNGSGWPSELVDPLSKDTGNEIWNSISLTDSQNGWAVGRNGAIAQYQGGAWSKLAGPLPTTENLNGVDMVGANDGWAVGASGKIIRYQDGAWTASSLVGATDTGNNAWQDVFMLNANLGWVVGNQGLIYKWEGDAWSLQADTGNDTWYGVYALGADDVWIVGSGGKIGHWDGATWDIRVIISGEIFRGIDIFQKPDTTVIGFAVGTNNVIFRLDRAPTYVLFGELISSAFDMGNASPVQVLEWQEVNPCEPTCRMRIQLSVENSSSAINWKGPDGTPATYFEGTTPVLLSPAFFNGFRWLRYKIRLEGPGADTPKLQEIKINYK